MLDTTVLAWVRLFFFKYIYILDSFFASSSDLFFLFCLIHSFIHSGERERERGGW